jgi:hypothetical protein
MVTPLPSRGSVSGRVCYTVIVNFDKVLEFLRALEQEGVEYVLVGGVAMNLNGITRATQDVDIVVRLEQGNVELLKKALKKVWADPNIESIQYSDLAGEFPAVSYGPPNETFWIDIVGSFGEAFRFENLTAQIKELRGVKISLATPETLFRMKRNTVRSLDRMDAALLEERYGKLGE